MKQLSYRPVKCAKIHTELSDICHAFHLCYMISHTFHLCYIY